MAFHSGPTTDVPATALSGLEFTAKLGGGYQGKVYVATNRMGRGRFGQTTAVKRISKSRAKEDWGSIYHSNAELRTLTAVARRGGHPFLVKLLSACQTSRALYLQMELATGGTMLDLVEREGGLQQVDALFYIRETILGLEFLHGLGVLHRDLKLDNILLTAEGHCKLADFGMASVNHTDETESNWACGTSGYMAPEVCSSHPRGAAPYSGFASDWYSLGVLWYVIIADDFPFKRDEDGADILGVRPKGLDTRMTTEHALAVESLLRVDPRERAHGAHLRLVEPLIGTNWDAVLKQQIEPPYEPSTYEGKKLKRTANYHLESEASIEDLKGVLGLYPAAASRKRPYEFIGLSPAGKRLRRNRDCDSGFASPSVRG